MIVKIVLVIVTAVHVNSQELCPSACQCYSEHTTCTDLFSDVTTMTQHRFNSALRDLRVDGTTNLELEEDLFLRWNITSLTSLDLSHNNITKIWQRAFHSLAVLKELDLSGNSITTLPSHTFYHNTRLVQLSLAQNSITDIQQSTVQTNIKLYYRVIHKSLRDFRTRLRNNYDRYGRKEHINRYRISPSFFCTRGLGVLPGSNARG